MNDEPCYSTDMTEWRARRAQRAADDWIVQSAYTALNLELLVSNIIEAMADEIHEYQRDHAYEHAGEDA